MARPRYTPSEIEPKWQRYWKDNATFRTRDDGSEPRAYILDMFPYPSGSGLHVGHPEGYTATDITARFLRAKGVDVLHPMGWDAFGLPAEQHAIRTGTHPRATTAANIDNFRRQLQMLGFSYDWEREIDTTDPGYVRWTQWIFLQLFHRGLAYQDEVSVNWCAALGTVLANEEVKDGRSEIGDHSVERVPLRQWMLRITAYADRLLEDLELADWPESTRTMQREWIGRSEGAEVRFAVEALEGEELEIFTTRPDTLFGATFMVIAPEHPLVERITTADQREAVAAYVAAAAGKSDLDRKTGKDKSGVATGAFATNPVNGERVPIWIADYVMMGYGTGAIMAVPAHDDRDFEFAREHGLPIIEVLSPDGTPCEGELSEAFTSHGVAVNSGEYDGLTTAAFQERILGDLESRGQGKRRTEYRLRDWVFSRQRYWGEPFPIYFPVDTDGDPRAGAEYTIHYDQPIAVDESELPIELPDLDDFKPGDDPAGPLARAVDWRFFERDGKWFARETNTMPQWAGSCWYYLRFLDPKNSEAAWSKEKADRWLPVDLYVGGAEHAVLHLLYARFWHKVLFDSGHVSTPEPFGRLVHQGMILGEIEYTRRDTGEAVRESDVAKSEQGTQVLASDPSVEIDARAHKMSKSRGNVVNPDDIVEKFGVDAMRVYEMFMGPLEATKPWNTNSIQGVRRFLERSFALGNAAGEAPVEGGALRLMHQTIRMVTEHIEQLRFNTAISQMMVFATELGRHDPPPKAGVETLALLVHPFAPHLAEEMWERLGNAPSIQAAAWPSFDPALCEEDELEIPVQVNGKLRGLVRLPKEADEAQAMAAAREIDKVAESLAQGELKKTIWVPGRILNLIVR